MDDYFREMAQGWDKVDWKSDVTATLTVRISQIETRILQMPGVLDITDTTLNGLPENWTLQPDNIPVRGVVSNV